MPRRVGLPGASELFRATGSGSAPEASGRRGTASVDPTPEATGRVRHDEKITVYVSSEELIALERLRLELRADHGVAVDRGRIVRAAIAEALADVAERGGEAGLLSRLTQQ